jgi:hypothetical protein
VKLKQVLVAATITRLEATADFGEMHDEGRMIGCNDKHAAPERHRRKSQISSQRFAFLLAFFTMVAPKRKASSVLKTPFGVLRLVRLQSVDLTTCMYIIAILY